MIISLRSQGYKAIGTVLGLWGGGKKNFAAQIFFYITLTNKMDTILFISIWFNSSCRWDVKHNQPTNYICDFQNSLSYQSILSLFIYTYLYVTIFKLFNFFGWQNIGGPWDNQFSTYSSI